MYRPTIHRSEAARAAKASSRKHRFLDPAAESPAAHQPGVDVERRFAPMPGPPRNKYRDHAAVAEPIPQPHLKRLRRGVGFQLSYLASV
jgi:hypothetical protein